MKRSGFETMSPYRYPFYILFHPIDGFQELRANKKGSLFIATLIICCWMLVEVLHRSFTDFDMNAFDPESTSLLRVALITVVMYLMACVSNWCFCTLLDGKGKLKDILVVGAYSLLPYVIVRFITIFVSHLLVGSEQMLLTYCVVISEVWTAFMIIAGLQEIHEYSLKKVLFSLFLTVVGIIIILFLALAFVQLFEKLYFFFATIILELRY